MSNEKSIPLSIVAKNDTEIELLKQHDDGVKKLTSSQVDNLVSRIIQANTENEEKKETTTTFFVYTTAKVEKCYSIELDIKKLIADKKISQDNDDVIEEYVKNNSSKLLADVDPSVDEDGSEEFDYVERHK